jgi:hypothetical protein
MFKQLTKIMIVTILIASSVVVPKLIAENPQSGKNIALGKTYTISVPPTTKWYSYLNKANKLLPRTNSVLTDGIVCKHPSYWVSSDALNFLGVAPIDVIIDLGKVYPISAISSNHSARPNAGIVLPKKETYWVSLDGDRFIKIAEYLNTQDPALATAENKKDFYTGIKIFSSGPIKTKGRYVLVRTYGIPGNPAQPGLVFANYIGHDEITVKAGDFPIKSVILNDKNTISLNKPVDESLTGYPFNHRAWGKLFAQTPLRFLLVPNSFNGSKTYEMSVGGVYVPCWTEIDNSIKKPRNITFKCSFPDTVEVISHNTLLPLKQATGKTENGQNITTYTYTIAYPKYLRRPFFFVKPKPTVPSKNIGTITFSWSYQQDGKTYSSIPENYTIVLNKKLSAPQPKRFKTGFWAGSPLKAISTKYTTSKQLFSFYKSLGFNWVDGGHSDIDVYKATKELKLSSNFEKGLNPNALMPGKFQKPFKQLVQKESPFIYADPKKNKRYGICPTKFVSGKYDAQMIAMAKNDLKSTHDIYVNWEPYMFLKKGCVCNECKQAFQQRYKLSDSESDKLWPAVTTDWKSKQHNEFFSEQLGRIMLNCQRYVETAARELKLNYTPSFIPSMHPNFFNPHHKWTKVHNPKDYMHGLNGIILWSYLNSNNPFSAPHTGMIGNNLAFLPSWNNALNTRIKWGRKDKTGHYLPKLYFLQTEYYFGSNIVSPKDYYFTSVLVFIHGLDGYGTWGQFYKQEARYLKQHVKTNTLISKFENIVLDGKIINDFKVTQQQPKNMTKTVLYSRGFKYKNRYFVAIGNDHLDAVEININSSLQGNKLFDKLNSKTFSGKISKGIKLTLPGKSWKFLELIK